MKWSRSQLNRVRNHNNLKKRQKFFFFLGGGGFFRCRLDAPYSSECGGHVPNAWRPVAELGGRRQILFALLGRPRLGRQQRQLDVGYDGGVWAHARLHRVHRSGPLRKAARTVRRLHSQVRARTGRLRLRAHPRALDGTPRRPDRHQLPHRSVVLIVHRHESPRFIITLQDSRTIQRLNFTATDQQIFKRITISVFIP